MQRSTPASQNPGREYTSWEFKKGTNLSLFGYSRCRDKTFLHVPELNLGLDCGFVQGRQPRTVLLSHGHADHSTDLPFVAQRKGGADIYMPTACVRKAKSLIKAEVEMNGCCDYDEALAAPFELHGVKGGDSFTFLTTDVGSKKRGTEYEVEVFDCVHSVPCVGFGVSEKRQRLKEDYKSLPGKEIGALKKSGVEVSEAYTAPLFLFMGDTHASVFDTNSRLFDYPVIITECTFPLDEPNIQNRALRDGHTCWKDLEPHILAHPDTTFVLIHFSLRYSAEDIVNHFDGMRASGLKLSNVVLFLGDHHHGKK